LSANQDGIMSPVKISKSPPEIVFTRLNRTCASTRTAVPAVASAHVRFRLWSAWRLSVGSEKQGEQLPTCSWAGWRIEMFLVAMSRKTDLPGQSFLSGLGYWVRTIDASARWSARSSFLRASRASFRF